MAETNIKDVKLKIGTETQFQSKLKELPLNTLVGTTDPIQEGELDTSIITKLNKAENALPKPTNDTTGSAGQVLKKTANGSEWGDAPSGGGKLYVHNIEIRRTGDYSIPVFTCQILNSRATQLQLADFQDHKNVGCIVNAKMNGANESTVPPSTYIAWNQIDILTVENIPTKLAITFEQTYPFTDGGFAVFEFDLIDGNTSYSDTVTEL